MALIIGWRWKVQCAPLFLCQVPLVYVTTCRYLGVQIVSGKSFGCSFDNARHKFYRIFNCLYAKSKSASSDLVTIHLVQSYCLPIWLYCSEVIPLKRAVLNSLNRCIDSVIHKVFSPRDHVNIKFIRQQLGLGDVDGFIISRTNKLLNSIIGDAQLSWLTSKFMQL